MGKRKGARKKSRKHGQKKRGRRFVDVLLVSVLLLAAYFAIFGGEFSVFQFKRLEALEAERAAELARAEAEIDSLQAVADRLASDPEAIERVARERYGMIRDGEILYRFREPDTVTAHPSR